MLAFALACATQRADHSLRMSTVQEIEQAARKLPRRQRLKLAETLLATLETAEEKALATEWATESESRLDAYESGKLKSTPASAVLKYRGKAR